MVITPNLTVQEIWYMIPPGKHEVHEARIIRVNGPMVYVTYPVELASYGFSDDGSTGKCFLIEDIRWVAKKS